MGPIARALTVMDELQTDMVDVVFPVIGTQLTRDHRLALATALEAALPWLAEHPGPALHRINTVPGTGPVALLSQRARLILRMPRQRFDAAQALAGTQLDVGGHRLRLGDPHLRELLPHGTLYADFVAAPGSDQDSGEAAFLDAVDAELTQRHVACKRVCGRRQAIETDAGTLTGYSLMLFGLGIGDSLRILEAGVGDQHRLGCGLFVPHRSAAAVGAG